MSYFNYFSKSSKITIFFIIFFSRIILEKGNRVPWDPNRKKGRLRMREYEPACRISMDPGPKGQGSSME